MLVKPAPGRRVRHPQTRQPIPEAGVEVPDTDTYWARRLADGDVAVVRSQVPAAALIASSPKGKE